MKTRLFLIFLLLALVTTACATENNSAPTAKPETGPTRLSVITAEGKLLPAPSVELSFAQGGVISEILTQPGKNLEAEDVIARLIGFEAAQAQLAAAELELASAKKALSDLQNTGDLELAQVAIDLKDAKEEYEDAVDYLSDLRGEDKVSRTDTIRILKQTWKGYQYETREKNYKGPVPEDWIIEAENDLALDKAKMDDLQRTYDRLKGGVDSEQLPVFEARLQAAHASAKAAEAAVELYELRAPFEGVLLSLDLTVGESVSPALPVAFLADPSIWTVETKDLAETDVANVAIGDPVTIELDAFLNEEFKGTVTEIDPVGREYLGDMTYKVTVTLQDVDPRFLWNMTATVTIE